MSADRCGTCSLTPSECRCAKAGAGAKFDGNKPRWDLLPYESIAEVVDVLTYGAAKYAPDNWRKVPGWRWRYFRAAVGHLVAWWRGERVDTDSGKAHLAHAACCVLFLMARDNEVETPTSAQ